MYLNIYQFESILHRSRTGVLFVFHRAVKSLWVFKVKFWYKRDPIHAFPLSYFILFYFILFSSTFTADSCSAYWIHHVYQFMLEHENLRTYFHENLYWGVLLKFVGIFWCWLKSDSNNGHFIWRRMRFCTHRKRNAYIFGARGACSKSYRENRSTFYNQYNFPLSLTVMEIITQHGANALY
jgi:hypothetical protein